MKRAKNRKTQSFVYEGFGFPIKLIKVPMKKVFGEWVIDVDMNKLQVGIVRALIHKPVPLAGRELRFIRKFLDLSMAEFGKLFGVSHVAVMKWENAQRMTSPPMEVCIRLHLLEHLHVRDREFRNLYNKISQEVLTKVRRTKITPLAIDASEDWKIAL